jgi:hypothetical protein
MTLSINLDLNKLPPGQFGGGQEGLSSSSSSSSSSISLIDLPPVTKLERINAMYNIEEIPKFINFGKIKEKDKAAAFDNLKMQDNNDRDK